MTWRETYEKWLNSPALSEEEWKELDAIRDNDKEIEDRFYAPLVFGTAEQAVGAASWVPAATA